MEVTLSLAIAAFCLLTLFGLVPVGLTANQISVEQTGAAAVASRIVADLRSTGTNSKSPMLGLDLPAAGVNAIGSQLQVRYFTGSAEVTGTDGTKLVLASAGNTNQVPGRYRATIGFTTDTANGSKRASAVRVLVTWPAVADQQNASWPTAFQGSYEVNTALDR